MVCFLGVEGRDIWILAGEIVAVEEAETDGYGTVQTLIHLRNGKRWIVRQEASKVAELWAGHPNLPAAREPAD